MPKEPISRDEVLLASGNFGETCFGIDDHAQVLFSGPTVLYSQTTRSDSLEKLMSLKKGLLELEKELTLYGDSDPAKIEEAKRALFLAKEGALRWTGSICTLDAADSFDRPNR